MAVRLSKAWKSRKESIEQSIKAEPSHSNTTTTKATSSNSAISTPSVKNSITGKAAAAPAPIPEPTTLAVSKSIISGEGRVELSPAVDVSVPGVSQVLLGAESKVEDEWDDEEEDEAPAASASSKASVGGRRRPILRDITSEERAIEEHIDDLDTALENAHSFICRQDTDGIFAAPVEFHFFASIHTTNVVG